VTLLLLVPVLYVNQEMVARLGAVTGVGHARLILVVRTQRMVP
jgi:Mn2+/Fe2+ NRAMP family transporter